MDAAAARMDEAEQRINYIEDKLIENNEAEKKTEIKAKEHNLRIRESSDSLKRNNIRIIGVPEEGREIGVEGLGEQIIAENFPNLGKDTDIKIQEAQRTPIRFNKDQLSTRHIYHSQIHKILRQGENHESSKGKKVPKIHGKTDQVCSRPIHRILEGQKGMAGYIQRAKSEEYAPKNSLSSKAVTQKRRRDKEFPR